MTEKSGRNWLFTFGGAPDFPGPAIPKGAKSRQAEVSSHMNSGDTGGRLSVGHTTSVLVSVRPLGGPQGP